MLCVMVQVYSKRVQRQFNLVQFLTNVCGEKGLRICRARPASQECLPHREEILQCLPVQVGIEEQFRLRFSLWFRLDSEMATLKESLSMKHSAFITKRLHRFLGPRLQERVVGGVFVQVAEGWVVETGVVEQFGITLTQ